MNPEKTIREAYGEALVKYGKNDPRVVVLDADVSSSTKSGLFAGACPERFFNLGIAKANMTAMAAGFAAEGRIPFVNTFAVFLATTGSLAMRTFGGYAGLPVKYRELICRCAGETGGIVTAEEHNIIGGLGSAVAEVLAEAGSATPLARVGIGDRFTETGSYAALQKAFGLDAASIAEKALSVLRK